MKYYYYEGYYTAIRQKWLDELPYGCPYKVQEFRKGYMYANSEDELKQRLRNSYWIDVTYCCETAPSPKKREKKTLYILLTILILFVIICGFCMSFIL